MKVFGRNFSVAHIIFLVLVVLLFVLWGLNNFIIEGVTTKKPTSTTTTTRKPTTTTTTRKPTTTTRKPTTTLASLPSSNKNVIQDLLTRHPVSGYEDLKGVSSQILDYYLTIDANGNINAQNDSNNRTGKNWPDSNYRSKALTYLNTFPNTCNVLEDLIASTGSSTSQIYVSGNSGNSGFVNLIPVTLADSASDRRIAPSCNGGFRANKKYLFFYYPPDFGKIDKLSSFITLYKDALFN